MPAARQAAPHRPATPPRARAWHRHCRLHEPHNEPGRQSSVAARMAVAAIGLADSAGGRIGANSPAVRPIACSGRRLVWFVGTVPANGGRKRCDRARQWRRECMCASLALSPPRPIAPTECALPHTKVLGGACGHWLGRRSWYLSFELRTRTRRLPCTVETCAVTPTHRGRKGVLAGPNPGIDSQLGRTLRAGNSPYGGRGRRGAVTGGRIRHVF